MLIPPRAVIVGGSAGGLSAMARLLAGLPAGFPLPMIAVFHAAEGSTSARNGFLSRPGGLEVVDAEEGQEPRGGRVHMALPDLHLVVEPGPRLSLCFEEKVNAARPSIDVLFLSAAEVYGGACLGILLSGASSDGAEGLARLREAGAAAFVQDPDEAEFPFMPRAALERDPAISSRRIEDLCLELKRYS